MELLAPISDPLDIVTKAYVDAGFMGAWSSGTAYRPSQIVSYAGNLWAANTTPLVGAVPGISGSWTRIGFVNDASGSTAGAMSSTDFTKLAGFTQAIIVDVDKGNVNQGPLTNATPTKLALSNETSDAQSKWDTTLYRFTPGKAGRFEINGQVYFEVTSGTPGANSVALVYLYKNGSSVEDNRIAVPSTPTPGAAVNVSLMFNSANNTDYCEIWVQQNCTPAAVQIRGDANLTRINITEVGTSGVQGPTGANGVASGVSAPITLTSGVIGIPDATASVKGAATAAQITKLDSLYTPSNSKGVAVEATNLNNLAQTGMYQTVPGCLNMPLATLDAVLMTYWFVQHYEYDQSAVSKYARQVAYPMSSGRPVMAVRNCIAGTWGAWIVTSNMPRVAAYCSSGIAFTIAAGWTTMVYQTELVDIAGEYNTSTGVWVAPADVWVEFNVSINFGSPPAGMRFVIGVWNAAVEVKRVCDRFNSTTGDMKWDGVAKFQAQAGVSYRVRGISTGSVPTTITCGTGDVQCFMTITI